MKKVRTLDDYQAAAKVIAEGMNEVLRPFLDTEDEDTIFFAVGGAIGALLEIGIKNKVPPDVLKDHYNTSIEMITKLTEDELKAMATASVKRMVDGIEKD